MRGSLEIEITESTVLSKGDAIEHNLAAHRELGVGVALDDFGTGYSSLTLLQTLEVDTLKIDRSFTSQIVDDPTTRVIVSSLIQMASALGIVSVAEGVETPEEIQHLFSLGCQQVQGFLLAKPMEGDDLLAVLGAERPPWADTIDHFKAGRLQSE